MAIFRNIHLSFWTDPKVTDDFTPEDKYFFLYVMTNPHTNLLGCYEISKKQMSDETGYTKDTIEKLLDRMENIHGVLYYSDKTKELYIVNWCKYNWSGSDKQFKAISEQLKNVKNEDYKNRLLDTLSIRYAYPMDTTDTDTDTDTVSDADSVPDPDIEIIKRVIDYLNNVCGTKYRYQTRKNQSLIKARLNEDFTEENFKTVIDKKFEEWGSDAQMSKYLRPETLFGTKFESYLNQKSAARKNQNFDLMGWAKKG